VMVEPINVIGQSTCPHVTPEQVTVVVQGLVMADQAAVAPF